VTKIKINELIEMLERSKENLGDVEVHSNDYKITGINNEKDHIEII